MSPLLHIKLLLIFSAAVAAFLFIVIFIEIIFIRNEKYL